MATKIIDPLTRSETFSQPAHTSLSGVTVVQRYGSLLGRILLSSIFLMSGFGKVMDWSGTQAEMTDHGMVLVPLFLFGAIAFELGGGLSILLGLFARWGALVLFLYLIPTTLVFHDFWNYEGPAQKMQMINFMKNLAIMGGLWMVIGLGPCPISLDRARGARCC
jgi:putative oxidoreductase